MKVPENVERLKLYRTLQFVWQCSRGWTIANIALVAVQSVLPAATLYLVKLAIDTVTDALAGTNPEQSYQQVAWFVGLAATVALFEVVCRSAAGFFSEAQAQTVSDHMHQILHAKSIQVDLEYFQNSDYYDTLHRAQNEAHSRPGRIVECLISMFRNGLSLTVMAGLLLTFHWSIAVILFVSVLPAAIVRILYARRDFRWQQGRTPWERRARYFNWMMTTDRLAKEVRLFELGPLFMQIFSDVRDQLRVEKLSIARRRALYEAIAQTGAVLAMFGIFAVAAFRTLQGLATLGDMVLVYQAFQRGQTFLRDMLRGVTDLYGHNLFLTNVFEFLDLKQKIVDPPDPVPFPNPIQHGLEFRHLTFSYPNREEPVLKDISLSIQPGEMVALVGENGSGKSTLVNLLCRLYDPAGGDITIDGVPISQYKVAELRRAIGVTFQDYTRYHRSVRENIWYGNIQLDSQDDTIEQAAREAGADRFINDLKHRYETVLGTWFEDGEDLSIGQWQRIALARGLVRESQIIVLDEPTSALDARAEYDFFERFRCVMKGRTSIVISHRFSTVRMADQIFVFENGRVIERGSHDELIAMDGKYATMFEMQARHYR